MYQVEADMMAIKIRTVLATQSGTPLGPAHNWPRPGTFSLLVLASTLSIMLFSSTGASVGATAESDGTAVSGAGASVVVASCAAAELTTKCWPPRTNANI